MALLCLGEVVNKTIKIVAFDKYDKCFVREFCKNFAGSPEALQGFSKMGGNFVEYFHARSLILLCFLYEKKLHAACKTLLRDRLGVATITLYLFGKRKNEMND